VFFFGPPSTKIGIYPSNTTINATLTGQEKEVLLRLVSDINRIKKTAIEVNKLVMPFSNLCFGIKY
jgi:hypothetical protein